MLIVGGNQSAGGYEVDNSLRFNRPSDDYLNKTFSSAGNTKKMTLSFWLKRSGFGSEFYFLYSSGANASNRDGIRFFDESLDIILQRNDTTYYRLRTKRLFRDFSAWYHIVVAFDTTQGTSSNRMKLYVNGVQETSFTTETYPTQNLDLYFINTTAQTIGSFYTGGNEYDGYMAEMVLIDGQQLEPTSFGEFDEDSGVWKPISVSGLTFGTNGFYLPFKNSAALGQDDSGNGNNFTVNNLTSIDQTTDTPTNNYCTLNPLVQPGSTTAGATHTFSNGNLTLTGGTSKWIADYGTFAPTQGKWYYEMKLTTYGSPTGSPIRAGWGAVNTIVKDDEVYFYGLLYDFGTGTLWAGNDGSGSSVLTGQTTFTQGDIVGVAVDLTNDEITYYKNGTVTSINAYDYSSDNTAIKSSLGNNNAPYILIYANNSNLVDLNFGNAPYTISSGNSDANGYGNFEYSVPSGYYALNTKNLAEYG